MNSTEFVAVLTYQSVGRKREAGRPAELVSNHGELRPLPAPWAGVDGPGSTFPYVSELDQ